MTGAPSPTQDEVAHSCRDCRTAFSISLRKHHCRGCGGIFCEDCCPPGVRLPPHDEPIRACFGCQRGETPGEDIVRLVTTLIEKRGTSSGAFPAATAVLMHTGSLYGDDDTRSVRLDGSAAHQRGYFEIVNKSNEMIAVKLIQSGGDAFRELCRPAYLAVPPNDSIYALFDCNELEVLFLYRNPNRVPHSGSIVIDTRAAGASAASISPCATVRNFIEAAVYRVPACRNHNVLLKYKGDDDLQTRQGTSLNRISGSILSRMGSGDKKASTMDFKTNVDSVDFVFSSISSPA